MTTILDLFLDLRRTTNFLLDTLDISYATNMLLHALIPGVVVLDVVVGETVSFTAAPTTSEAATPTNHYHTTIYGRLQYTPIGIHRHDTGVLDIAQNRGHWTLLTWKHSSAGEWWQSCAMEREQSTSRLHELAPKSGALWVCS